jgi:hypothetical protein
VVNLYGPGVWSPFDFLARHVPYFFAAVNVVDTTPIHQQYIKQFDANITTYDMINDTDFRLATAWRQRLAVWSARLNTNISDATPIEAVINTRIILFLQAR